MMPTDRDRFRKVDIFDINEQIRSNILTFELITRGIELTLLTFIDEKSKLTLQIRNNSLDI